MNSSMILNTLKWMFGTNSRLNRKCFLLAFILFIVISFIDSYVLILFKLNTSMWIWYIIKMFPWILFWIAIINRLHDMWKSWWFSLLNIFIIPIIWEFVWKWDEWTNKYWPNVCK